MFWERFYNLCLNVGSKPNPIGKQIGISSATITQWKSGAIPNGESLIKLASYFGCSVDYLLGRVDNEEISVLKIKDEEIELLKKFNILNGIDQKRILKQIDSFLQDYTDEEKEAKNTEIA